jgi:hypothetical protein
VCVCFVCLWVRVGCVDGFVEFWFGFGFFFKVEFKVESRYIICSIEIVIDCEWSPMECMRR